MTLTISILAGIAALAILAWAAWAAFGVWFVDGFSGPRKKDRR